MFLVVKFLRSSAILMIPSIQEVTIFLNFVDVSDKTYLIILVFIMNFFLDKTS